MAKKKRPRQKAASDKSAGATKKTMRERTKSSSKKSCRAAETTALAAAKDMAEKIVDTVRESMLVLNMDLRVVSANQSFYERFEVAPEETEGRLVYELGNNQWDIPELRTLLEVVLPDNNAFNDYEVEHEFETIGRRVMKLNGRRFDHIHRILLAIEDITEYRLAEARRTLLLELTDGFHAAETPQDVLDQAAARLCKFLRCQHAAYVEVDVKQNEATILFQHAEDAEEVDRKHTLSDFGPEILTSLLENEEVVIDDTHDDRRVDQQAYREAFEQLGTRALACTSRRREGGLVAMMSIGHKNAHKWEPDEITLIRDVAERTWTALEAARVNQALSESESRYRQLFDQSPLSIWEEDWSQAKAEIESIRNTGVTDFHAHFAEHPEDIERCMNCVRLLATNHASLELYEAESSDHLLEKPGKLVAEESWNVIGNLLAALAEGKTHYRGEQSLNTLAGKKRIAIFEFSVTPGHEQSLDHCIVSLTDITRRKQTELELQRLNETLEEQVSQRTEMLKLLQDITRKANESQTVEEAMYAALERISQYNGWQVGHVWKLAEKRSGQMVSSGIWYTTDTADDAIRRLDELQQVCDKHRFSPGEGLVGAVMQTGEPKWIDDVAQSDEWQRGSAEQFGLHAAIAFPVTVNGEVVAVLEFFSDHFTRREERFMEIMPDVGIQLGHVIERKRLEKEVADATSEQQRHLGRELHDSVSQELSGVGMMAQTLAKHLAGADWPQAESAQQLVDHLRGIAKQISRLSHGLMPVDVDAEGLMAALDQLAYRCDEMYEAQCEFQCRRRIAVADNDTATHLYRIAQEAIQNATKHGSPSRIEVKLEQDNSDVILTIQDDGSGLPADKGPAGAGLRIMQYRANLIGARLKVDSQPSQGVTVTCRLPAKKGN